MPLTNPPYVPPPEKPETPYDRLKRNPVVFVFGAAIAAMVAFEALRVFFTETLPWLLSFVEPVARLLAPLVAFLQENVAAISVGLTTVFGTLVFYRLIRKSQEFEAEIWRTVAERQRVYAEAVAKVGALEAENALLRAVALARKGDAALSEADPDTVAENQVVDDVDVE